MNWGSFVSCMTFSVIFLRKRKRCTMVASKSLGHSRGLEFISVLEKWVNENFLIFGGVCLFGCVFVFLVFDFFLNRGRGKR